MTPEMAIAWSTLLLEHFFGRETEWYVRIIDEWPGRPDVRGHCDGETHCISLVEKYLENAAIAVDTIAHEVAHTISYADNSHGERFRAAKEKVMAAYEQIAFDFVYRHPQRAQDVTK
jgi:hypothetical protein